MIKYLEHRGSLEESLKTCREFHDMFELFEFISDSSCSSIDARKIKIMYYGWDDRVRQQLFVVSADDYGVFGFIYEDYSDGI